MGEKLGALIIAERFGARSFREPTNKQLLVCQTDEIKKKLLNT